MPAEKVTIHVRTTKSNAKVLREEARREGVSLNVLLCKIVKKFASVDRFAHRQRLVTMSKATLSSIIEHLPKESIAPVAKRIGGVIAIENLKMLGVGKDRDSALYVLQELLSTYSGWFSCEHYSQPGKDSFYLYHDMGPKWSIFLENYIETMLTSHFGISASDMTHTEKNLSFNIQFDSF